MSKLVISKWTGDTASGVWGYPSSEIMPQGLDEGILAVIEEDETVTNEDTFAVVKFSSNGELYGVLFPFPADKDRIREELLEYFWRVSVEYVGVVSPGFTLQPSPLLDVYSPQDFEGFAEDVGPVPAWHLVSVDPGLRGLMPIELSEEEPEFKEHSLFKVDLTWTKPHYRVREYITLNWAEPDYVDKLEMKRFSASDAIGTSEFKYACYQGALFWPNGISQILLPRGKNTRTSSQMVVFYRPGRPTIGEKYIVTNTYKGAPGIEIFRAENCVPCGRSDLDVIGDREGYVAVFVTPRDVSLNPGMEVQSMEVLARSPRDAIELVREQLLDGEKQFCVAIGRKLEL